MSKLVTIYGGSGFVGRYIARRMAKAGWRVRVAVRNPNEAIFVRPYGVVGQVEPILCNIRDDASVRAAMQGAEAVVNCVGILVETGRNRFDPVQAEGAARVARLAAESNPPIIWATCGSGSSLSLEVLSAQHRREAMSVIDRHSGLLPMSAPVTTKNLLEPHVSAVQTSFLSSLQPVPDATLSLSSATVHMRAPFALHLSDALVCVTVSL